MAERRRLPVLQEPSRGPPPADDGERPPWHWVGFGVVAIFAAWLPLAYAAQAATARVIAARLGDEAPGELSARLAAMPDADRARLGVWLAIPHVLALGLAALAGGFLVGRFGARTTAREAGAAGASAALLALALSVRDAGLSWSSVATLGLATLFAAVGGSVGARSRRPG